VLENLAHHKEVEIPLLELELQSLNIPDHNLVKASFSACGSLLAEFNPTTPATFSLIQGVSRSIAISAADFEKPCGGVLWHVGNETNSCTRKVAGIFL
jgi:hypothetical protein